MKLTIEDLHNKALQALSHRNYQQAYKFLITILQQDKFFADGYFLMAMIASLHQNTEKALQLIIQAVKLSPQNGEYLAQLAKHYAINKEPVNAKESLLLAEKYQARSSLSLDTIGVTYSMLGLHQNAIKFFLSRCYYFIKC